MHATIVDAFCLLICCVLASAMSWDAEMCLFIQKGFAQRGTIGYMKFKSNRSRDVVQCMYIHSLCKRTLDN